MITDNRVKAVIFDIDNTLYDYDAAHAIAFEALTACAGDALSLDPGEFARLHSQAERELANRCGGNCAALHNRLLRYQVLLEGLGRPVGLAPKLAKVYWSTFMEALRPDPGAARALARLRGMGLKVGIGTNMTADYQYEKLERMGLMPCVDFMVTSEEVTAEKPDRRLFDACARKAGCEAGACVFVGDSLSKDVKGAMDAGMRAMWLCRPGQDPAKAIPGAAVVRALDEIPDLISQY